MKGPVEPVHRSVPETIQEVIELTGFLCFLFRSTPNLLADLVALQEVSLRGTLPDQPWQGSRGAEEEVHQEDDCQFKSSDS